MMATDQQLCNQFRTDGSIKKGQIEELISLTQHEIFAYSTFLNQLLAQQHAIIDRDILRLTHSTEQAESMGQQAKELTLMRKNKMNEFLKHSRQCKELATLEQVIPMVKQQYAHRLAELRERLLDVLKRIQETNQRTAVLLSESIKYVNKNLQIITSELQQPDGYGTNSRMKRVESIPTILRVA